ncbi:MAG: hypothetical protein GY762_00880 [Proteobacteria bacterium]|nr:hypothetical protein [Pseudomonadota bacterium]
MQVTDISVLIALLLLSCTDGAERQKIDPSLQPLLKTSTQDGKNEPSLEVKNAPDPAVNSADKVIAVTATASENGLIAQLGSGRVIRAIPISKRSLSLKIWLDNGIVAVFKPMLTYNRRAAHEVAVFKLAKHLDVRIVPPSTMRSLPLHLLVRLIKKRSPEVAKKLQQHAFTDNGGAVLGAMIHWVENLDSSRLKKMGGSSAFTNPLTSINPSANEDPLVEQASNMIVFDYATGNWDRFSGGNLFVSPDGSELVLLDNNSTFALWSKRQKNRMVGLLRQTMRFSARLIEQLENLTAENVPHILSGDQDATPQKLLSSDEIELLLHRRDTVLSHVERLKEKHGRQNILAFP